MDKTKVQKTSQMANVKATKLKIKLKREKKIMAKAYEDVSLDEAEVQVDKYIKLKFTKVSQKIRVGFPHINPDTGKVIIRPVRYFPFHQELKKSFLITGDKEFDDVVARTMGEPKVRYVAAVCVYKTDDKGQILAPFGYEMKPYVFSDKPLGNLQSINMEFPIAEHDLMLTATTNEKELGFQAHTMSPTKDAKWCHTEKMKDEISAKANMFAEHMHKAVAMEASKEQIEGWLGLEAKVEKNPADAGSSEKSLLDDDDLLAD